MLLITIQNRARCKWARNASVALALCCAVVSPSCASTVADDFDYDVVQRDEADMVEKILSAHNAERARQGQSALQWDTKLARDASRYAQSLADEDRFEHAAQSMGDDAQGENLWMGSKSGYDWSDMVAMWLDEGQNTKSGTFPNVAKTGNWSEVGHYTQMIWPETKSIGCGLAANRKDEFLVCRYHPAGNVIGQVIKVKSGN
jgi:uncharacterized protein YkwD